MNQGMDSKAVVIKETSFSSFSLCSETTFFSFFSFPLSLLFLLSFSFLFVLSLFFSFFLLLCRFPPFLSFYTFSFFPFSPFLSKMSPIYFISGRKSDPKRQLFSVLAELKRKNEGKLFLTHFLIEKSILSTVEEEEEKKRGNICKSAF